MPKYYLLALVLHDQDQSIERDMAAYGRRLAAGGLDDIPFHAVDLLHGHKAYEGLDLAIRKKMLGAFASFVRKLPIRYTTFVFKRAEIADAPALAVRMRRELTGFIQTHLETFQSFDTIAVYYDGGQKAVTAAVRGAFDHSLAANTAVYKKSRYQERRLAQAADYFCSVELAALKYADGEAGPTYVKVYGGHRLFRANFLKQARRMRMERSV